MGILWYLTGSASVINRNKFEGSFEQNGLSHLTPKIFLTNPLHQIAGVLTRRTPASPYHFPLLPTRPLHQIAGALARRTPASPYHISSEISCRDPANHSNVILIVFKAVRSRHRDLTSLVFEAARSSHRDLASLFFKAVRSRHRDLTSLVFKAVRSRH